MTDLQVARRSSQRGGQRDRSSVPDSFGFTAAENVIFVSSGSVVKNEDCDLRRSRRSVHDRSVGKRVSNADGAAVPSWHFVQLGRRALGLHTREYVAVVVVVLPVHDAGLVVAGSSFSVLMSLLVVLIHCSRRLCCGVPGCRSLDYCALLLR